MCSTSARQGFVSGFTTACLCLRKENEVEAGITGDPATHRWSEPVVGVTNRAAGDLEIAVERQLPARKPYGDSPVIASLRELWTVSRSGSCLTGPTVFR